MEVIEEPAPTEFDFSTNAGTLEFVAGSLENIRFLFSKYGYVTLGLVCIATRLDGRDVAPFVFPILDDGKSVGKGGVVASFHALARSCRAIGALVFGEAWAAEFKDANEAAEWSNRDLSKHPKAFEVLHVTFDHQTLGHQAWQSRVTRDGATGVSFASPFELQESEPPEGRFSGLLEHLNDSTRVCCQCGSIGSVYSKYGPQGGDMCMRCPVPIDWVCVACDRLVCINCVLTIPGSVPIEIMDDTLCSETCRTTWELRSKP